MVKADEFEEDPAKSLHMIRGVAIFYICMILFISVLVAILGSKSSQLERLLAISFIILTILQCACIIIMWVSAVKGLEIMQGKIDSVDELGQINGCSDEYTQIPIIKIKTDVDELCRKATFICTFRL